MAARVSQDGIEALIDGAPSGRVTQIPLEALIDGAPNARISQVPLEVLIDGQGNARISQGSIEALLDALPGVHISQIVIEVLARFIEVPMPLVFPTLKGIKPNVDWETEFFNAPTEKTVAGGEVDIGLADTPIHTFTLSYAFLRTYLPFTEEQLLRGFFGANRGNLVRFLFKFEQDYKVSGQVIGTTDGTTRIYTLVRTYGVGEASWSEPIGYLDQTKDFNVYLDGVIQDKSSYTIDTTIGAKQQIIFAGIPATGQEIEVDMEYFYYCKFADPKISLSKFLRGFWAGDSIAIKSCRPGL